MLSVFVRAAGFFVTYCETTIALRVDDVQMRTDLEDVHAVCLGLLSTTGVIRCVVAVGSSCEQRDYQDVLLQAGGTCDERAVLRDCLVTRVSIAARSGRLPC